MVEIRLDKNDGEYKGTNETVKVESSDFGNHNEFKKVTYTIKYKDTYESTIVWFWWYSSSLYLYIKDVDKKIVFTYYTSQQKHIVRKVEAYYNKNHDKVPLVIGFGRGDGTYYNTYSFLKGCVSYKGYPPNSFQSGESDDVLKSRLKDEDDRVNRVKFTIGGKYQNCNETRGDVSGKFRKFCYNAKHVNRYDDHELTKKELFRREQNIEVHDSYFSSVNNKYFDQVCVYCTNEDLSKVMLVEFVNGGNKKYISRQDKYGYYWAQDNSITNVENDFEKIQNDSDNKITFILTKKEGSYGLNSINVNKSTLTSYNKYTHKPQSGYQNKKSYILQNGSLITLETINEITTNKLNNPQNRAYKSVTTFFKKSSGIEVDQHPFFLELHEHGTSVKYHLQRVDKNGIKWTQTNVTADDLQTDNSKRNNILKEVDYYGKKSILILVNENNNQSYPVKIIYNSTNEKSESSQKITVRSEDCVSGSSYTSCKYDLSNVIPPRLDVNPLSSVNGIRIFIASNTHDNVDIDPFLEIKPYDRSGVERRYLYFDVSKGDKNNIYIYVLRDSKVPLLFYHSDKFYWPKSMDEYFTKWIEILNLRFVQPCDKSSGSQIKNKMNEINKNLNQVDLSRTNGDGYGIKRPGQNDDKDYYKSENPQFDGKRIKLSRESGSEKFCKLTHITTNNQAIGRMIYNGNDLQDADGGNKKVLEQIEKDRSRITNNSVSAYYYKYDSRYKMPLLIGIFTDREQNNKVFYQRVDSTLQTKWKKLDPNEWPDLQDEGDKLVNKINTIHYNIGKSIIVRVDHQPGEGGSGSSNSYPVQLVPNTNGGGASGSGSGLTQSASGDITVTNNCSDKAPPTGYTCFTHQIPSLTSSTSSHYISGLKLYVCDNKYLETYTGTGGGTLPIHYNPSDKEVKVYFYQHGISGTSRNTPDKVPLLVEYAGTHYKPQTRDGYFKSWVTVDVRTEEARGDTGSLSRIGLILEQINKDLNQIQLEKNNNGSYGLTKPGDTGTCASKTPVSTFCEKVTVKRGDDGAGYYLKVTHATNNKGPIGDFKYGGSDINGIKVEGNTTTCNQVDVYYRANDNTYSQPLLVCITTQDQGPEPTSGCKKWFSRMGVDVKLWNNEDEEDNKFGDNGKIKDELEKIYARMANYLLLQIQEQGNTYQIVATTGSETQKKEHRANISIDSISVGGSYKADHYRIFQHKLQDYYNKEKEQIKQQLGLQDQGDDPTLQVRLYIFNNYFLGLYGEDGQSTLTNPLVYGKDKASSESNDPYVYFFERTGYGDDTTDEVPLLVKYGERYFGPIDKAKYFEKWKEYTIETRTGITANNIKATLNKITRKLNEIDLQETGTTSSSSEYGDIKPTQGSENPLDANKRVTVTRNPGHNNAYLSVTHSTKNTGCVGTVKYGSDELQVVDEGDGGPGTPWSTAIEKQMSTELTRTAIYNDLTVYYHYSDKNCKTPLLIKITGDSSGSHARIDALYYERFNSTDQQKWKKVTNTSSLQTASTDGLTNKINEIFYNFNKSVKIEIATNTNPGASYLAKLVKNGDPRDPGSGGIKVTVSEDKKCSVEPTYTCIKHTVSMNTGFSSQVGGLRFYFNNHEAETFKDSGGKTTMPVFYDDRKKEVHVYLQDTTKVPLLFRYNSQCFRPLNKTNYFTKWVYDSGVSGTRHPSTSTLNKIATMLNEVNLENTGNGGSGQQYGLDTPKGVTGLDKFDGKRITATRTPGDKFGQVTHATIDKLGIGPVRFGASEVKDNTSPGKNLSESVKQDPSMARTVVNQVTVYYHTGDTTYSVPLMLGFGSTRASGPEEASATTPKVFYERVDAKTPPVKWSKVQGPGDLGKPDPESKIAQKLNEIRYQIGKSVVITVTKQTNGAESASPTEYQVQVVDNKGGSGRLTDAGTSEKIQVTKSENCTGTDTPTASKYTCYNHQIPDLKTASDHPLIGGVKFYVCDKNHTYLPTFGLGGYLEEPIYYNATQSEVKVYFYSNGHGPPDPDKVPLLVQYGTRYYRPSSRSGYFDKWVATQVQGEGQQAGGQGSKLQEVLDTINKDLNTVDLGQTGTTGAASGYGLGKPSGGNACPSIKDFCDRVSVTRKAVTQSSQGLGGGTSAQTTLFHRVTHTTTNKGGIGSVCYAGQVISAIKTTEADTNSVCNQVEVYYDAKDNQYKTPLLLCLCQQTGGQASEPAATNTQCKTWYQRTGIDITDWVAESDASKYSGDDGIQKELAQILNLFKDYLYLDIGSRDKYQPSVQHQTGPKQKVGGDGQVSAGGDNHKIKVTEANTGGGASTPVPDEYKAYTHGLKEFYKGAKAYIQKALNPASENEIPEDSGDEPTLHLRFQIAGQVLTLFKEGGGPLTDPLKYGPGDGDKNPVVYFYGKGGSQGAGTSTDTVPLLFRFDNRYFGPKDPASYFHGWCEYEITGGADGAQNTALKTQLDNINRQLNEIDLTQTGTGTSSRGTSQHDYGLEKPNGGLTGNFKTTRIQVTRKDNHVTPTSSYVTVTHTTTNGFHIGPIKNLGKCTFDNQHNGSGGVTANQAVAVYGVGASTTSTLGTPSLVLICSSAKGLASSTQSTVLGYYDLTNGGQGVRDCNSARTIQFKKVSPTFTVGDLTDKEKVSGDSGLLGILTKLNIVKEEVKAQAALPAGGHGHSDDITQEEGEDDRDNSLGDDEEEEAGVPAGAHGGVGDRLGRSGGVSAGTIPGQGTHGPSGDKGETGEQGDRGIKGERGSEGPQTERTVTSFGHTTTPTLGGHEHQPRGSDGGGNGRPDGGEQSPQGKNGDRGETGPPGESSAMAAGTSGSGSTESGKPPKYTGDETFDKIIDTIVRAPQEHPTEFYGGTGGVAGVGVMGTVGAVVYKN